ncbi:hypothetical protein QE152_g36604 [Popillia japonica]|uniref:Integrase catalytic domain-containing protein n=1 Tax=Popillia japonica TaxID=7064 RepID=A0AAW1ICX8_POPJA
MVLSDNGPPFNGNAIKQFFEAYGIEHKRITPYWPEANGITESLLPSCEKNQERDASTKDEEQRLKHKAHADSKRKTRPNNFQIGDRVLCKIPKANTLTPRYDPKPYTVCEIKGTQVKAKREDHIIVRNASFFKHFLESSTHPDIPEPVRTKRRPKYLAEYMCDPNEAEEEM